MIRVGIVGAGTMGSGIAAATALSGHPVVLHDAAEAALVAARGRISAEIQRGVEKGKITSQAAESAIGQITFVETRAPLAECSLIIEAIVEDLAVKRELFVELDRLCPPGTILATNTSSLSVTALAAATTRPAAVVGLHFFNPPVSMKLVEVVRGERTSDATMETARTFVGSLGKTAIVARDTPGFIVNRVARPFYGEALRILGEGVATVEEIDRIVKLEGGFRMGPFELMDLIGIDINLAVTRSMYEQTFHEPRYRPHLLQQAKVNAGHLGRKSGKGFYTY